MGTKLGIRVLASIIINDVVLITSINTSEDAVGLLGRALRMLEDGL